MSGQMTHMEVAYRVAEKMNITAGKAEFILGSVAPDAISDSVPFWETKVHTHLFEGCGPWGDTWDYDRWLSNIDAFWNEYGAADVSECKYCTTMQMLEFIDICTDRIYDRISDYKELGAAS